MEKKVSYKNTNTYSIKNELTDKTKNIWFACHGLGYLSKYFIEYFNGLDSAENYIIAPQAPSKFYQGKNFKYVGASWLTRENTEMDSINVLNYLQTVATEENVTNFPDKLIVLGYSQGVSVTLRWIAKYKINCKSIIINSGGIPKELTSEDFKFLPASTQVYLVYGTKDEYLTKSRMKQEKAKAEELFGNKLIIMPFDGNHRVDPPTIYELSNK